MYDMICYIMMWSIEWSVDVDEMRHILRIPFSWFLSCVGGNGGLSEERGSELAPVTIWTH